MFIGFLVSMGGVRKQKTHRLAMAVDSIVHFLLILYKILGIQGRYEIFERRNEPKDGKICK
jgi:hypothetical protein